MIARERSPARRRLGDVRVLARNLERVPNRGRLLRLDEPKVRSTRRLVFARRILGARGKASFATQVFEASLVTPLTALDGARLEDLFAVSTHVGRAFERYEPESVDLVTNLWGAVDSVELRRIRDDVLSPELSGGIALDRVLEVLADAGLSDRIGRVPQIATLQLVSPDHCMRADEFVYTRCRVFDR